MLVLVRNNLSSVYEKCVSAVNYINNVDENFHFLVNFNFIKIFLDYKVLSFQVVVLISSSIMKSIEFFSRWTTLRIVIYIIDGEFPHIYIKRGMARRLEWDRNLHSHRISANPSHLQEYPSSAPLRLRHRHVTNGFFDTSSYPLKWSKNLQTKFLEVNFKKKTLKKG